MGRRIKAVVNSKIKPKSKHDLRLPDNSPTPMVIDHEGPDELSLEEILTVERSSIEKTSVMRNFRAAETQVDFLLDTGSRKFQILSKIPMHLFDCADDIVTVCCALVNLQPCVIAYEEEE